MCTPIERDPVTQKAGFGLGRSNAAAIREYRETTGQDATPHARRELPRASVGPLTVAEWELQQIELAKKDPPRSHRCTKPMPPSTALPAESALLGLAGALLVGLVAGLIPAITGARASVVQALRG
jgi:hypothetical protein